MAVRRERLRRQYRRHNAGRIALRVAIVAIALATIMLAGSVTAAFAVVNYWLRDLPNVDKPGAFAVAQPSKILSADGQLLASLYLENREVVPLSRISTDLVNGIVAVEDERFYEHSGVDPVGIIRAGITDLARGHTAQGASTITMQYVRNTVLSAEKNQISAQRKIREAYLANELEKRFTKEQLLSMYLNTVYFGEGSYGAQAAALTYFAKPANKLNLAEASMLAGLPQSPNRLDPYDNLKGAKARQSAVLARMVSNGYITADQATAARKKKLTLKRYTRTTGIYAAPYFVSYVKKLLEQKYGTQVVYKGGLTVFTTLDTATQSMAESAANNNLGRPGDPDVALVAIDPTDGTIKAMVGGRDYTKSKFNLATQSKRQAGSAFKPFVLATALAQDIPPYRAIDSASPAVIPPTEPGKPDWVVSNSEGQGQGYMRISNATWHSVNTVFARLIHELGAKNVRTVARAMGIKTTLPEYDSIGLGTVGVTPLEMASAYSTLANQGIHNEATAITKVVGPMGKLLYVYHPSRTKVLSRNVAYAETKILEGVIQQGTATGADINRPAAGKTGTSQNYRDAWFVGYTPQLTTAVWVGYAGTEKPMTDVHGIRVFGGTFPASIWRDFMRSALATMPVADFVTAPDPVYTWNDNWHRYVPPPPPAPIVTKTRKKKSTGGSTGTGGGGGTGGSGTTSGTP
jgi:1A family penicillin-binding protein